jgi:hypothetical protein
MLLVLQGCGIPGGNPPPSGIGGLISFIAQTNKGIVPQPLESRNAQANNDNPAQPLDTQQAQGLKDIDT